jgi:hypothetical protein
VSKSRKPAIDWQSRVSEKSFVRLEFQSHDAQKTGAALPNGHAAIDGRVLQHLRCKRGLHRFTGNMKHHSNPFVKVFPPDKKLRCGMAAWC